MTAALTMDAAPSPASPTSPRPLRSPLRFAALAAVFALAVGYRPATHHVEAAKLLVRFADTKAEVRGLAESEVQVPTARGPVRAKLFAPPAAEGLPGIVLVHGIHEKGIDEVRLNRFARAVAATGVVVLAPEIAELSDYRVEARSKETIGAALHELSRRTGRERVGLMGMSFGGGIALLTAADPRFRDRVGFVVAVGAHDDLARVLRFFATNEATLPDGSTRAQKAHEYGATVLVYNQVEDFFPAADVPEARAALNLWLRERRDEARAHAALTSPASRERLERVFAADLAPLRPELVRVIDAHAKEDRGVSPHGHLEGLRAPVYLLHGEDDPVIPASETRWLARDVPPSLLRQAVVTPAIQHVEVRGEPTPGQKWELIHFMGEVLGEAHGMR